jgi:hypothetical protein
MGSLIFFVPENAKRGDWVQASTSPSPTVPQFIIHVCPGCCGHRGCSVWGLNAQRHSAQERRHSLHAYTEGQSRKNLQVRKSQSFPYIQFHRSFCNPTLQKKQKVRLVLGGWALHFWETHSELKNSGKADSELMAAQLFSDSR